MIDQLTLEDVAEGERLKSEGMARAAAAEQLGWNQKCDLAIRLMATGHKPFTAEHVRRIAGDPEHPNAFGARFNAAARAGIIRKVGYELSTRPTLHRHPIAQWVGV